MSDPVGDMEAEGPYRSAQAPRRWASDQRRWAGGRQKPRWDPDSSTLIVTLGFLSLVCALVGPFAWALGNEELRRIDAGEIDPATRTVTAIGRACGKITTILAVAGIAVLAVAASVLWLRS